MSSNGGGKTFPVFVRRETSSKVDTFGSFADDISINDISGALSDVKEVPYSPTASTSSGSSLSSPVDEYPASIGAGSDGTASTAVASPTQPPVAPVDMSDMDVTLDMSILDRI
jgi:hypothetical protein